MVVSKKSRQPCGLKRTATQGTKGSLATPRTARGANDWFSLNEKKEQAPMPSSAWSLRFDQEHKSVVFMNNEKLLLKRSFTYSSRTGLIAKKCQGQFENYLPCSPVLLPLTSPLWPTSDLASSFNRQLILFYLHKTRPTFDLFTIVSVTYIAQPVQRPFQSFHGQ